MSADEIGLHRRGQNVRELSVARESGKGSSQGSHEGPEAARIRAARAKLIEETTYQLTDLFTIVSARIELLNDRVSPPCREELSAIRKILLHGVELNKRLYMIAEACKRETNGKK